MFNLHTFLHVSVQVIFLDMISDEELDKLGIREGFPRVQHLTDKHLDWLMKQDFDSLNVSVYYAYSSIYLVHAAC